MFARRAAQEQQQEPWVVSGELPAALPDGFSRRVNATFEKIGFARQVWAICETAYADASKGGRPGIDPVVYLKMLTVGFFEDLPSKRAIASRCADSLSIRGYLGYSLTEATPDHSSLSVIRDRLSLAQLEAIHGVLLAALHAHGLLKGRKLGLDSSVIEASASPRALKHRNSAKSYWEYVKRLAAAAGLDPTDTKAVRRFDKPLDGLLLRPSVFLPPSVAGRRADLQLLADLLHALASGQQRRRFAQLLDDLFGGVSFAFHVESSSALAHRQSLIAPGSTFREQASGLFGSSRDLNLDGI